MQRFSIRVLSLFVMGLLVIAPGITQDDADPINLTAECVSDYDAEVDYFPEEAEITDAENFTVDYFNNYKVVTVTGSMQTFDYVLVQCGTPAPDLDDFPEGTQLIEVPTGDLITFSTTFLPGIAALDLTDNLIGMDSLLFTSTPQIIERIDAGEIIEVSPGFEMNLELVLDAEPDLVMADDFDQDRFAQLTEVDIFTAINTDYLEATPLGRAEWIKYTALFYNEEARAEEAYAAIVENYEAVSDLTADIPEDERPTVLWNGPFQGEWGIPGGETFAGRLLEAAGANLVLSEADDPGVQLYALEAVYEAGLDADAWIMNLFGVVTVDDLLAIDPRLGDFAAVQNGNAWNNDLDSNVNGGNNYFELGVTNPDIVLSDLVAIFHPDLLPDHEFTFFRPLEAGDE